jgi:hypothetical protein
MKTYFIWCDHLGGTGWYVISRLSGLRVFVARLKADAEQEAIRLNEDKSC